MLFPIEFRVSRSRLYLSRFVRALLLTHNWYDLILCELRIRKNCVLGFKNGLKFYFTRNEFPFEIFYEKPYASLSVAAKDVIDIGAYNRDSSVYFAVKRAKRVIAFEPFPHSFNLLEKNIALNHLEHKIVPVNSAVSGEEGFINLPVDKDYVSSKLIDSRKKQVRVITLQNICESCGLDDARLKIDCEGCEFSIILHSPPHVLRHFQEICLEYHSNPSSIRKQLEEVGYVVRIEKMYEKGERGILFAELP